MNFTLWWSLWGFLFFHLHFHYRPHPRISGFLHKTLRGCLPHPRNQGLMLKRRFCINHIFGTNFIWSKVIPSNRALKGSSSSYHYHIFHKPLDHRNDVINVRNSSKTTGRSVHCTKLLLLNYKLRNIYYLSLFITIQDAIDTIVAVCRTRVTYENSKMVLLTTSSRSSVV